MTTYYVSSEIGNDNNAGTSGSAPLATLQEAADLVKPGDTVEVMNGTYTGPAYGDVLDITTSGTASAPITFEAAPGQTPVINSSGAWNAINIEASYIVVSGFTVVGDAANYTLQSALAGYSTGNANLDGNGISINPTTSVPVPNHITIENNTVYDEPGGGIATAGADYVQILNNVVHDNAHWSAFGNSGISIWELANSDTNSGVHDIVSGNISYDNTQLVPTSGDGVITDGEGIILDTNTGYVGEILVENNTTYGNSGPGIESFLTNNAVITGNTTYGNNTGNVQAASNAEIFINQSNNDTVTNNITTAPNTPPPAAPVISSGVVNSSDSVVVTGTAPDGATVTVSDGGSTSLGTTTASSTGSWTFTTADLAAGSYAFTATDTTSAGTSAASSPFPVTVTSSSAPSAAPVISSGVANSSDSVVLTGTAPDGATVTVSDGGSTSLGTTTASSTGSWSFTTADLAAGSYAFTATDTTSAGTSAASSPFPVTVTSSSAPSAAPVISGGVVNSSDSVVLTGTAPDGATVTVSDGGSTPLGTTTASSTGSWTFTTANLAAGTYAFTATDTTAAGTNAASSPLDVTVPGTSPQPSGPNFVANGNFATGDFTDWTLGGNYTSTTYPQEISIDTYAEGGSTYAAGMGSVGSDGTLSQTIATTAGQTYTLTFWLENDAAAPNDFSAIWNGQTLLSLSNAAAFGYTEYTYTVTATGSSTVLEFSAMQNPSQWDLDNISLTANGTSITPPPATPVIETAAVNPMGADPTVTLTGTAPDSATVTVADGGSTPLGTTTASSTGSWSFTTADLAAGSYVFTATDTTSTGTSASSSPFDVTVQPPASTPPAAPVINSDLVHSNHSVILKGTAPDGGTVTVSDGGSTPLGTTTASSTGSWSFTTADLAAGTYDFTATDTTSAGTSAASTPFDVTVHGRAAPAHGRAAPAVNTAVNTGVVNVGGTDPTVTLTGTAPDGTTVTVSDAGSTPLGTTTASSSGAWSFTTPDLPAGNYAFTVTDTTPTGTTTSNPFDVTVPTPSAGGGSSGLPRVAFDPPTTLGSWSNSNQTGSTSSLADIALLGNHIASSFALPSGSYGGTMVNPEATAFGTQPLVANPHHA